MSNSKIVDRLSQHILTDGFHVVVDTSKSHGSWIVDLETGKEYLDCYSQFASQPLGWKHPALMKAQNEIGSAGRVKLANSDMYSEEYVSFVEKFSEITPDFKYYFFIDGGALGVENALKAAFDWKAKKLGYSHAVDINNLDVFHLKNAFHGRTGYTLSLTNTTPEKTALFPKFKWTTVEPNWEDIESRIHKEVAAIIIEPIQGEGGDNHFPPEFFTNLRRIADENDCLLIFDEVQTGMGLTGKMWAYEHFGVIPDMMCFGKKSQVCGFCSTERIDEVKDNVFHNSGRINSTWGGNIVDMVRSRCIIDAIQKYNLLNNVQKVGKHLLWDLRSLPVLDNVRGRGLMIAFDFSEEYVRDLAMSLLSKNMLALKCGKKSIRLRPPLTFSVQDADNAYSFIREAIENL
jgi:L-lysine 6-transaminase